MDLTANRENARLHVDELKENLKGTKAVELKDICYRALKELMKLIMVEKKDGLFRLDPYVRQIAFKVFANNPFKYLKVEFGRIQIQKLLNKANQNES